MVARVIEEFDDLIATYIDSYGDGAPSAYTRAYVEATFEILTGEARAYRRWSAITAAAADPEQAEPLNEAMRRWHGRDPAEDPDPGTAMVVRLAAEGSGSGEPRPRPLRPQLQALRHRLLALLER